MHGDALDYGCGWGDICHLLAPRFRSIVGIDVSADRVDFASAEYAPLPFEQCPAEGLRFADASFDAVLSIVVLPFVPDGDRYLGECRRVLRPGGQLLLVVPNPDANIQLLYRLARRTPPRRSRNIESLPGLEAQLAGLGFAVEARDAFYDPPFDRLTNPAEVVIAAMNTVGHLVRHHRRASYVGYRARLEPHA